MADPRRISTRRAVLSYAQVKQLTLEAGFQWPDLLVKDYQGILQDFAFTSDELDILDLRITNLEPRVDDLEARIFRTVKVTEDATALSFQVVLCDNTDPIDITLDPDAVADDMIHVMRRNAEVTSFGLIDGDDSGRTFNVQYQSELYIYDGTEWSSI